MLGDDFRREIFLKITHVGNVPGTEPSSAFSQQVLRPLVTLAVPGLVAGGPWFLVLRGLLAIEGGNPHIPDSLMVFLFTLTVFGAGMLVDSIGTLVEAFCFDKWRCKRVGETDHLTVWDRFLLLTYNGCEPVGHRYLRTLVQALKFELNTATAVLFGLPAAFFLLWIWPQFARVTATLALVAILIGAFLTAQAWITHGVLGRTRKQLVERFEPYEKTVDTRQTRAELRE